MNKVILIKYGELTTKKSNRKFFINTLYNNILKKLKDLDVVISKDISRMYIEYDSINENLVLKRIGEIFGIHAYEIAYKVETDKDNILDTIKEVLSSNIDNNNYTVDKILEEKLIQFKGANKPICATCIAPMILAKIFKNITITLGNDANIANIVEKLGNKFQTTKTGEICIDKNNKIITTPFYMLADNISQIYDEAYKSIKAMIDLSL